MRKTDTSKKRMLRALKKHKGLVVTAANAVGISKSTHYAWYHADEAYKEAVDKVMDLEIEYVECKLGDLIEDGNASAIQFYLKNKSKDFQPTIQVDAKVEGEITVNQIQIINPGKKK